MSWVVVVTGADGTKYAYGPTRSERNAIRGASHAEDAGNEAEILDLLSLSELDA